MTDITALIESLRSTDPSEQQAAAERLARLGPDARPAAVSLVEACATHDEGTREWITSALEDLGPPRSGDSARLAALVANRSLDVAYWAATLLGRLRDEAGEAVPELAAAVDGHPELAVRQRAAWALGKIGPAAASARGALEKAAGDADRRLAALARDAMAKITQ